MSVVAKGGAQYAAAFRGLSRDLGRNTHLKQRNSFKIQAQPVRFWICPACTVSTQLRRIRHPSSSAQRPTLVQRFGTNSRRPEGETRLAGLDAVSPRDDNIKDENLPSRTASKRSQISKRMSHIMDTVLMRASIASQHINVYTGTDYSGIEVLRKDITSQEDTVKEKQEKVEAARTTHRDEHTKQGAAQKEMMGLLERKSSWTPGDLERYMSLVRSEHTIDQAVQTAKDDLARAERDLEDARGILVKLERKQYHEEQIWSDTIRRNSTWVTFGLMGVNILLLLTQIAVFEPWRRHKIVKEVREALNEKTAIIPSPEAERRVEGVVEPKDGSIESVQRLSGPLAEISEQSLTAPSEMVEAPSATVLAAGAVTPSRSIPSSASTEYQRPSSWPETWSDRREAYWESLQDLFSERIIQVKKVDLTTTALQGAATGVAVLGFVFLLFKPR